MTSDRRHGEDLFGYDGPLTFYRPAAAMTPDKLAVLRVAGFLHRYGPLHGITVRRRRFWRKPTVFEFVPIAREIVASMYLLPEGRTLSEEVLRLVPAENA